MRHVLCLYLSAWLIASPLSPAVSGASETPDPTTASQLQEYLARSYQELFELAPTLNIEASEFSRLEELLNQAEETCTGRLKDTERRIKKQLDAAQKRLRRETGDLNPSERHGRHCEIQHLRAQKEHTHMLATHAVPLAYSNRQAKLKLLRQWPADLAEIRRSLPEGSVGARAAPQPGVLSEDGRAERRVRPLPPASRHVRRGNGRVPGGHRRPT